MEADNKRLLKFRPVLFHFILLNYRYLAGRLALQIPATYRSDSMEILVDPKDASSAATAWKGATVLSCLETAQELWISPLEWTKHGSKLLRERAPFPWI